MAALVLVALNPSAQGQTSVTLAWDPSPGSDIAGYRLYEGGASRTYTNVLDLRMWTNGTFSALISGATYFFAATAYSTNGLESDYSLEVSYTVPLPTNNSPAITLTSPANGSAYVAPATINLAASVTANGHAITQVQFYNGATLLGSVASAPYTWSWNNVSVGNYSLSAKAVYDSGSTVASASANVTVAAAKPVAGLTFAADSGTFTAPFVANNGTLSQSVLTVVTNGGRAVYPFNVTNAGNYLVSAMVIAPNTGENSLYVNIDAEPTDPLMIWDIPPCSVLTNATVSWRGNGNGDPASSQYIPAVFALSAGTHQLIITGREANTTLGTITIAAITPPTIALTAPANNAAFTAPAAINLAASVTANGHSITQVQFYNGATLLGSAATTPYNFSWTNVSAGSYSLTAQAVYDSGSTVASTAANVTVTNVPLPSVALISPADGASYLAPATISLAASVTTNGHSITQVQFYAGATLLGTATKTPFGYSWTNVNAASYSLTARAVYDSGSTVSSAA